MPSNEKKYDPDILSAVIDNAPEGIMVTDRLGRIIMVNPVAERLFPNPIPQAQPISSHTRLNLCYLDGTPYAPADLPLNRTALHGQAIADHELLVRWPDGQMRHLLVSTNPILDASGKHGISVGFFRDITQREKAQIEMQQERTELQTRVVQRTAELEATVRALEAQIIERKSIEAELRRSEEEFRRLSRRILEALEADRQLVAKELHDSIGASLAAIKFSLEEKLTQIERSSARKEVSLESILGYLVDTIKETKRIAAQLRPATLDDLGLLPTISWYIREFSLLYSHINVALKIDLVEEDIPTRQKIVFYRIIQETMNNAAKHGRPDTIRIHLAKGPDGLTLCVEDNGRGFDAQQQILSPTDPLSGYGLQGMRERAEICGGRFEVSSQIGSGTRVYVLLPAEGF